MRKIKMITAGILSLLILCGCSSGAKDSDDKKDKAEKATEAVEVVETTDAPATQPATKAPAQPKTEAPTQPKTEAPTEAPEPTEQLSGIPLLSINTVSDDPNVMDFVIKPVTRHVAESIASWTPGYKMPPEPYYEDCTYTLRDGNGTVLLDGVTGKSKVRGNWTTSYEKKPLRIKFDEKQSMLGMNDGAEFKNWVLMAEYKDASMLRNKAALAMSREILGVDGLYASDARLVEVEINGNYWGMYLLTEFQQVNDNRVDITDPKKDYTGVDIGYFIEFDGNFENEDPLHSFHVEYNGNAPIVPYDGKGGSGKKVYCLPRTAADPKTDIGFTIKSDINCQEQHDFIANFVNSVYDIMYHAAYEGKAYAFDSTYTSISETDKMTPREAVEAVVDVDSLADMYIISEMTCDADIYWSSFFMDVDFGEGGSRKLRFEAPWDFDSALGNKDRCADGTGFYAANIVPDVNGGVGGGGWYNTINPWLAVLMYEDWYQDIIRQKWTAAYDSGTFDRVLYMIAEDTEICREGFERSFALWGNIGYGLPFSNELCAAAMKCRDQQEAAEYLASWLAARTAFMNEQWGN